GITHYTVGQRKGLGLSLGHPVFVLEIRPDTNEVVIGENEDVFTKELVCDRLNRMAVEEFRDGDRFLAKVRYGHRGTFCRVEKAGEDSLHCIFEEPVRAVTPGQA
ncbi:MAG TPA: tRNA 2-thiouridine(34) synthase MnmA, partial [Lachnospiraceae bacterium]|nr:tRNA 2-thiouridine(34) synthase MnmA [Lachnospiraceae bacterium]